MLLEMEEEAWHCCWRPLSDPCVVCLDFWQEEEQEDEEGSPPRNIEEAEANGVS